MKKKNLIVSVVSLALVAALGMGATLAYLTDNEAVTNTFTTGNVKIDLEEPDWDPENGQDLEPGDVIDKNPRIINTGKNSAYMMIQVEGVDDMREKDFEVYFDDVNWVLVDATGKALDKTLVAADNSLTGEEEALLVDGYYAYVGTSAGVVAAGKATTPLFEKVYYTTDGVGAEFAKYIVKGILNDAKDGVSHYEIWKDGAKVEFEGNSFASYDLAADYIVSEDGLNAEATTSYTFDLDVAGYGIQSENIEFVDNNVYGWVATVLTASDAE